MKKRVIVVGAGVIGLSCAVRLAKAGAEVTLLEAEGEHPELFSPMASIAAAGMLAPLNEAASVHDALALESYDLWRSTRVGAEWADGVRFDGAVALSHDAAAADVLASRARSLGRSAELLSASQFEKRTGLRARVEHALFLEAEGIADPMRVLTGLAMQARALGVLVQYRRDVESVSANSVTVFDEPVREADAVVLAPGAWASRGLLQAAPALQRVRAGKGHMAAVALERPLGPNLRAPGFYLAQQREGVVLGATLELDRYDRRVEEAQVAGLYAAAEQALPGAFMPLNRAWCGVRPMSPDGWPLLGPNGDGVLIAAGHSRNGWLLAPITAEIITAYVFGLEIAPAWAALAPERFDTP